MISKTKASASARISGAIEIVVPDIFANVYFKSGKYCVALILISQPLHNLFLIHTCLSLYLSVTSIIALNIVLRERSRLYLLSSESVPRN